MGLFICWALMLGLIDVLTHGLIHVAVPNGGTRTLPPKMVRRSRLDFALFHESSLLKTIAVVSMLNRVHTLRYERSTEPCAADDAAMCAQVCLHHIHATVRTAPLAKWHLRTHYTWRHVLRNGRNASECLRRHPTKQKRICDLHGCTLPG